MSPSRATLLAFFGGAVVLPLAGLAIAACSDATPPPGVVGGNRDSGLVGVDGGGGPDGATSDSSLDGAADSAPPRDGAPPTDGSPVACNTLAADGPLVPQTAVGGSQPMAAGGHVFTGTYFLTDRITYGGTPDGLFVQRSLFFGSTTVDVVEGTTTSDAGVPSLTTRTSTYQVFNTFVFSTDESCPGPMHVTNMFFTAVGGTLTLYPSTDAAEVYALQ